MSTLKNSRNTTTFTIPQYPTTNNPSPHIGGGSESCCKGGKSDGCMSDIFRFWLSGTDGVDSGMCAIVVLGMV